MTSTHSNLTMLEQRWLDGDLDAGVEIGIIYIQGKRGIPENHEKGLDYLRAAARGGSYKATDILALYFGGRLARLTHLNGPKYALARYWLFQGRLIQWDEIRKCADYDPVDYERLEARQYSMSYLWLCQDLVADPAAPGPKWAKYLVRWAKDAKENPPVISPTRQHQYTFLRKLGYYETSFATFYRRHRIEKPLNIINYLEDVIENTSCPYFKVKAADRLYRDTGKSFYRTRCMQFYEEFVKCEKKHEDVHCLMKNNFHSGILPSKLEKFRARYRWKRVPKL